jgi:hypothetical protein
MVFLGGSVFRVSGRTIGRKVTDRGELGADWQRAYIPVNSSCPFGRAK